ncbi:MAG: prephenate dehydrogenase [Chloroflexota bacterium]
MLLGIITAVMWQTKVSIVGLGLMGGSLALAIRLAQRSGQQPLPQLPFPAHITIVDTDAQTRQAAARLADVVTADFAEGVREAELVILATPVRTVLALLEKLAEVRPQGCMVLDLGSTKRDICAAMAALPEGFEALGGHPMCGKETGGFGSATPDLYRDKTFVLCRTDRTSERVEQTVLDLLRIVGAKPLFLPPEVHDEMVAAISHLPYVAAGSLMRTAAALADDRLWTVSASGFRDTSRVSGTDSRMMLDILLTNKTAVLQQLRRYQDEITAVTALLEEGDEMALAAWLAQTQQAYAAYRKKKDEG